MSSKYEWIATDRQFFGQPNTAYDFKANMNDVGSKLAKMQERKVNNQFSYFRWVLISETLCYRIS